MSQRQLLFRLCAALTIGVASGGAQQPLSRDVLATLQRVAGPYSLDSVYAYRLDSVVLVLRDSTLTAATLQAGTWMFGPPTTKAEEDGCPPEKVLGRRLARRALVELGSPAALQLVTVRIRGPMVADTRSKRVGRQTIELLYPRFQLTGPWVGDRPGANRPLLLTNTGVSGSGRSAAAFYSGRSPHSARR